MAWTDYSTAPKPGTQLAPLSEVKGAIALTLTTDRGDFPVLLLRTGAGLRAYVNACPHQYLPLDYRGPQILSADGGKLMCTAHGAMFDATNGDPISGADCALDRVPLQIVDGMVVIGAE